METKHLEITTTGEMYHFRVMVLLEHKFGTLEALVKFCAEIGFIGKPLMHKERHKREAEKRYRSNMSKQPRIMCWFCKQYHGPIHFCSTKRCFLHIDYFNMLVLQGPSRESVECPAGCSTLNTVKMTAYRNKFDMI